MSKQKANKGRLAQTSPANRQNECGSAAPRADHPRFYHVMNANQELLWAVVRRRSPCRGWGTWP